MHALVLELVEGETLQQRLSKGPLPLNEALRCAVAIAEALEAAHDKGIIHRDLKPANIKFTRDGSVKVLDFGLAKAAAIESVSPHQSALPTDVVDDTREGTIVGTAGYMSPEQALGNPVDKRTDIWAFGCVLYEMLTGRAPFPGETISRIIASVLERDPEWGALAANVPPGVVRLIERCLEKDARRRLRDMGDARIELNDAIAPSARSARPQGAVRVARLRHVAPAAAAIVLVLLAGGAILFYQPRSPVAVTSPSEYTQLTNFTDSAVAPSLSPDGRMVAFIRGGDSFLSAGQIHVKLLPNGESVRLTNTSSRKYGPVFTPDGSRIAYSDVSTSGTSLLWDTWTVPVLGGDPRLFLPNASGLIWIAERQLLFAEIKTGLHMGIVTATENRAESRAIYFPSHESAMAHYAYASPDRRSVLVVEMDQTHAFHQACRLVPFDGTSAGRQVGPQGTCTAAAWSPDGRRMYFSAVVEGRSHLWRQTFPDGAPEQITFGPTEEEGIAVAPDGRSLITSLGMRESAIWIHDAAGERAISSEGYAAAPRLSADNTRVFYLLARDWVLSAEGWGPSSSELRAVDLASGKSDSVLPGVPIGDYDISRDGKEIAFTTTEHGEVPQIWLASVDRRTPPRVIARGGDQVSFGADDSLIFRSLDQKTNLLSSIRKDGTGRKSITTAPIMRKGDASADGEWVAAFFLGDGPSSPDRGVFAIPVRGGAPRRICPNACHVGWSSDGKFLYVTLDTSATAAAPGRLLAIPVPAGTGLPDLPAAGITSDQRGAGVLGASVIEHGSVSGPNPSTYVFTRTDMQRNLFRIPLH